MNRYLYIIVAVLATLLSANPLHAAKIDTLWIKSRALQRDVKCMVLLPENKDASATGARFAMVYLLHGYGGNADTYLKRFPDLELMCDHLDMVLICPDGFSSWYIDSPADPTSQYETFFTEELVPKIDQDYPTDPERRFATGFSMGGHGAFYLALRHPDLFRAAGSMSGGMTLRPFADKWDLRKILGKPQTNPDAWQRHSILHIATKVDAKTLPHLIFDCGQSDFFAAANDRLHTLLQSRHLPHIYHSRPGEHTYPYWRESLKIHLEYFAHLANEVSQKDAQK